LRLGGIRRRLADGLRSKLRVPLRRRISVICLVVIGLLVVGAGVAHLSHRPILCRSCHEMRAHLGLWGMWSHKDVTCDECHDMPGWTWMVKVRLGAANAEQPAAEGDPSKAHGRVRDSSCKKCHRVTRDVIVYHGLKITHKKHLERDIGCLVCHSRVVYPPRSDTRNVPTMQVCFTCHDGRTAPHACGTCHERRAAALGPEWVEGHKQQVKQGKGTCCRCHSDKV